MVESESSLALFPTAPTQSPFLLLQYRDLRSTRFPGCVLDTEVLVRTIVPMLVWSEPRDLPLFLLLHEPLD